MKEMGVVEDPLKWYLELRKFGSVPHAGESRGQNGMSGLRVSGWERV
jgi:aspartyl/asparaginyl-tRNA synthetase